MRRVVKTLLLICFFAPALWAQEIVLTGKVLDQVTGDPIPYCNIIILETYLGTSSNESGEFLLKLDSLPTKIVVSNINYQRKDININQVGMLEIALQPAINILDEVEVKADRFDEYALDIVERAFIKTRKLSNRIRYGKAFYRQKSSNADAYVELMEIFYDVRFSRNNLEDWQVQEGRYAENKDGLLNRNFTLLSRLFPVLQPPTDDVLLPMHEEAEVYYDFYLEDMLKVDNRRVGVISCTPKNDIYMPAMEGKLYIDVDSHDVLKVSGKIVHDKFDVIELTHNKGNWKNYEVHYEMAFKSDSLGDLLMDYVQLDQTFDYYIEDDFLYPVATNSFLSFYEYYQPVKNKKLGGGINVRTQDRDILDRVGYQPKFWVDNPIVKRTPIEEEVINSFEKDKAFGSIFLNSREQIALQGAELDDDLFIKDMLPKVLRYNRVNAWEKAHLHTDKDFYFAGDDLWYKAYVVDAASLYPADKSDMVYIDLINQEGKTVLAQKLKIFEGKSAGNLTLPRTLASGIYQLQAYTHWMRNEAPDHYYQKEIKLFNSAQELRDPKGTAALLEDRKIDLQFFPEGGNYFNGITSQVAFKAIGPDGKGIDTKGEVIDDQGNVVTFFKSLNKGMGIFSFKPIAGKRYSARLSSGAIYPMPEALTDGFVMTIRNLNAKSIRVRVEGAGKYSSTPFYIIGQSRGSVYYRGRFNLQKGVYNLEIPKNKLPSGIFQITLFDALQQPHAERMVFINQKQELIIRAQLINNKLESKKPVEVLFDVTDPEGRPVATELSVAITDAHKVKWQSSQSNILTNLLLGSDLKGSIEGPGEYFIKEDRKTLYNLDLVMLTNGWRKFVWSEVLKDHLEPKRYAPEKGITLKGKLVQPGTDKALSDLEVVLLGQNLRSFSESVVSDANGDFTFKDLQFQEGENLIFQVLNAKGETVPAIVQWQNEEPTVNSYRGKKLNIDDHIQASMQEDLLHLQSKESIDDDQILEEIVVKGKRNDDANPFLNKGNVIRPDESLMAYSDIFQLIAASAPGVQVSGSSYQTNITINGGGVPLIMVNGIVMNSGMPPVMISESGSTESGQEGGNTLGAQTTATVERPGGNTNMYDLISWIAPGDVDRIEVLKGSNASFYGVRGGSGVISIYTKQGINRTETIGSDPNQTYIKQLGLSPTKEFYHPKYAIKSKTPALDNRQTIYWSPNLTTDIVGRARIWFYNSDATDLNIIVEAISNLGLPGVMHEVISSASTNK